jgi:hypothetical protein
MSRTTDEELRDDKRDAGDCVVCGTEADGIDAGRDGNPPVCGFCAKVRLDGGEDQFSVRVGEMVREIEDEVDDSTPAEAMLYARCSAAFEDAVNNTDLPPENALGVMTSALFEAADTVGYARSDVIETAREHYVDDVERGDGPTTDGGQPAAGTGGGRHAPAMGGSTTPERHAHYCSVVGSTVYASLLDCPNECFECDP